MVTLEQTVETARDLLAVRNHWLSDEELRRVYEAVYPSQKLTDSDMSLQNNEIQLREKADAELGDRMYETYLCLVDNFNFLQSGNREHNPFSGMSRHLWETAYRTNLMGMPFEVKELALMHSLPEHNGRGLSEAKKEIDNLADNFQGHHLREPLRLHANWHGMLVDHLNLRMSRIAGSNHTVSKKPVNGSAKLETMTNTLCRISVGYDEERSAVQRQLKTVVMLSPDSKERLVPLVVVDNQRLYPEVRARVHRNYMTELFNGATECLRKGHDYWSNVLIVKGLCFIDRIRTTNSDAAVEKVTRESMEFLSRLDVIERLIKRRGLVDNPLAFVNAALKTELLIELKQKAGEARRRRDNAMVTYATVLERRLAYVMDNYASVASVMGLVPVYSNDAARSSLFSPLARS
ncbi:hypothetical protein HYU12_01855 [Candidatus Woesearchaeota archaeon]|nr:hypothetical protein [Candidatus Woesearchaeota archaeon]